MRKIILAILLMFLITGCSITGRVIQEAEKVSIQEDRDQADLEKALTTKDVSMCYYIQTQPTRESCFMKLAQELKDPSICNNLMGSLRESCKAGIQ